MSEQVTPKFTEAETKVFMQKKAAMYKGSIAICVVYGVLALGLVLFALFSPTGNQLLTVQFKMLTTTLVIGILVIIAIIVMMIVATKPSKINAAIYDKNMCPDYWRLQKTEEDKYKALAPGAQPAGGNVCVRDMTFLPEGSPAVIAANPASKTPLEDQIYKYAQDMNLVGTDGKLDCNRLYPTALGFMDEKLYPDEQNKMRCEIANKCGFAWSSVCP